MTINAKVGKGNHVEVSVVDECIELAPVGDINQTKLRIIPSTDIEGIFIEAYDENGNFEFRTGITFLELVARIDASKAMANGEVSQPE